MSVLLGLNTDKMKVLYRSFLTILFSVLFILPRAQAQNLSQTLAAYAEKYNPERAYIHYDKSSYSAGDTLWFKVYLMTEIIPADQSKTFYTDFIDDKGNLLQHTVSPLVGATTNGQYDIPVDYKGKYIRVRAYTRWMLNFDSAFLYTRDIRILNTSAPATATAAQPPIVSSLEFFPEGGDAIVGISNKIAFKATDQWGRPIKIKGIVNSNQGQLIDSIRTLHDGMGFFYIVPEAGAGYSAKWRDENNVEHTTALPAMKSQGASMQIMVVGTNRHFQVNFDQQFASSMDSVHLIGTMYQHEAFRVSKATAPLTIKGIIPTKDLPSGILTITLFDKAWKPIAERITFVNNEDYTFKPTMEVQHWGLSKRARNEIKITIPDSLLSSLSVAVTDEAIGADSSRNIISDLLLTSELKGTVYNPAYYFKDKTDKVSHDLDLVMLTHGWRRFKWDDVVAGRMPRLLYQRDTSYMTLSGNIMGVLPSQIGGGGAVVVMIKQKNVEGKMLVIPLMPDGTFNDPATIIFDTAQVYYQFQGKTLKDASAQFMTDRLRMPLIKKLNDIRFGLWPDTSGNYRQWQLANEARLLAEKFKVKTLENVTVKSRGKTPAQILDEKYTSAMFSGDGTQFDLVNDPFASSAQSIFTYLQGKVAGLQISGVGSSTTMSWRGGSPQLYLDEMPADVDFISSLNVNDVALIKVFRPPFMGGFNGANGAIAIYTRRGDDRKSGPGKGLANNKIEGYTNIREFYSPKYLPFNPPGDQRDVRTTLYWNPQVTLSPQKREIVLSFYNNDVSDAFRVIIEGMTQDGKLAHLEQIME